MNRQDKNDYLTARRPHIYEEKSELKYTVDNNDTRSRDHCNFTSETSSVYEGRDADRVSRFSFTIVINKRNT